MVTVKCVNETFPVRIRGGYEDGFDSTVSPWIVGEGYLEPNYYRMMTEPFHNENDLPYLPLVQYRLNKEAPVPHSGAMWKSFKATLKAGDVLTVECGEVAAGMKSAFAPLGDGKIVVYIVEPTALFNPPGYKDRKFLSSAMYIAQYGVDEAAKQIAEHAKERLSSGAIDFGYVEYESIGVFFQCNSARKVDPSQLRCGEQQIAEAIATGIRGCFPRGMSTNGTFASQVEKAKEYLAR